MPSSARDSWPGTNIESERERERFTVNVSSFGPAKTHRVLQQGEEVWLVFLKDGVQNIKHFWTLLTDRGRYDTRQLLERSPQTWHCQTRACCSTEVFSSINTYFILHIFLPMTLHRAIYIVWWAPKRVISRTPNVRGPRSRMRLLAHYRLIGLS